MVKAVLDTCILIDHLRGIAAALEEMERYDERSISIVTWMEVLVGATPSNDAALRSFLDNFSVVPVDTTIAEEAIRIRKARKLRLPDAIIAATANASGALLVTRNTKDFDPSDPGIRVPYQI